MHLVSRTAKSRSRFRGRCFGRKTSRSSDGGSKSLAATTSRIRRSGADSNFLTGGSRARRVRGPPVDGCSGRDEPRRDRRVLRSAQRGDAGAKLALHVNPTVALVIFLVLCALVGVAFAANVWGVSDRSAAAYRGRPWILRQIGRDNPATWRAGGFVMAVFGVATVAGILVLASIARR
jgi:hypothetical protein